MEHIKSSQSQYAQDGVSDGDSDGEDWITNASWPAAPVDHGDDGDEPMDDDNPAANLVGFVINLVSIASTSYRHAMFASSLAAPSVG